MKKLLLLIFLTVGITAAKAQNTAPVNTAIPPFKILTKDSTYLTPANLKKHKATIVVYFAPDCTHCQHFTDELKLKLDREKRQAAKPFTNAQVVMITFTAVLNMKLFYIDFGLAKYPNIMMGTEGTTYVVLRYYNVKTTPYIAVYDKNGKLIQGFDKAPTMEVLEDALKKA